METATANQNCQTARTLIDELKALGVNHFVYCPGSRCTPLGLALEGEDVLVHYDERGAAFYALGYARATGKPAPIICTSGTALANFYPAVVEAYQENLPLLMLTADRPASLWNTGANQTIDQLKFFGDYASFIQISNEDPRCVQTAIDFAYSKSSPVQVNLSFIKPLEGEAQTVALSRPQTRIEKGRRQVSLRLAAKRGVITLGRVDEVERRAALDLAKSLQWPLLPDVRSGLRLAGKKHPEIITHFAAMVKYGELNPDVVLHIGRPMLTPVRGEEFIWVYPDERRYGEEHDVDLRVMARGDELDVEGTPLPEWTKELKAKSQAIGKAIDHCLQGRPGEIGAACQAVQEGPVFVGNSLPVRHIELWAAEGEYEGPLEGNRGASGIDGQVASAAGFAKGMGEPVTLIIGDTSLLHDINSLPLAKGRVRVVVLNNDGGAIFSQLPIRQVANEFEKLWVNPHGMTFRAAAEQFGLEYGKELCEVISDRSELQAQLRLLADHAGAALQKFL